ncbi:MAG: MerR family transcriptional regulator [Chloroflexi bacterium AL-W]|nr:MerR family transcriptional regulator [Chloroflexi bacterium AL-N1]NOK67606.1 MerR family transcriptional regulator [Chloroflexi bacterium AL-N10]NOK75624.1 MerR family transcriptional regulator [Chloroflexi bacterium AL-N5]NOK82412.1 MerR family transcriptional regulator [Chloroflexi bacterium AL-W]NOK90257.1 MerR family transcriptional regulator [Chloroflexi bacterium AL-N15]
MSEHFYTIKVAAELCGMHEQSLRMYERRGLITPQRSTGNIRRFTDDDIDQIRFIKRLVDDLGVNLAGVEVIIHLRAQLLETQRKLANLQEQHNSY